MALAKTHPIFSVESYLDFERVQVERHEFLDGSVYAMAWGTLGHGETGRLALAQFLLERVRAHVLFPMWMSITQMLGPYAQLPNGLSRAIKHAPFAHKPMSAFRCGLNHGDVPVMRDHSARARDAARQVPNEFVRLTGVFVATH